MTKDDFCKWVVRNVRGDYWKKLSTDARHKLTAQRLSQLLRGSINIHIAMDGPKKGFWFADKSAREFGYKRMTLMVDHTPIKVWAYDDSNLPPRKKKYRSSEFDLCQNVETTNEHFDRVFTKETDTMKIFQFIITAVDESEQPSSILKVGQALGKSPEIVRQNTIVAFCRTNTDIDPEMLRCTVREF